MKKRSIALVLVLVLITSLFAACTSKGSDDNNKPADSSNSTNDSNGENANGDNADSNTTSGSYFPLAERKELGVWMSWDCEWNDDPNTLKTVGLMEDDLNLDVKLIVVTGNEAQEKFGLMMASGDFPDIIVGGVGSYYTGGVVQACEDGVIVDMTDYIQQYMPNYEALRQSSERLMRDTKTDDGRSITAYTVNTRDGEVTGEQPWTGLCLRQDWLNELNMEVPTTIDDWYEVLTAFKENYNCEAPLMVGSDDVLDANQDFLTAYGVTNSFYNDNGTVKFGPQQEGYRQWIELFRKWYAEGLLDQNFVTNNALYSPVAEYLGTGRCGASANLYSWTCDYYKTMGYNNEEDYWLVAAPVPVLNEGDTPQLASDWGALVGASLSVTTNCKDIELACRWLDYCYSEDWMAYSSYGIEGETYTKGDDGSYQFLESAKEHVVKDLEYPTFAEGLKAEYCFHNVGVGMYNWYALSAIRIGEPVLEAYDVWDTASIDMVLPARRSLTAEELTEYSNLYVGIQTLVRENTVKMITGTQDMSTWDKFQQDLETYGVQKCIDYQQAALDRYNAR